MLLGRLGMGEAAGKRGRKKRKRGGEEGKGGKGREGRKDVFKNSLSTLFFHMPKGRSLLGLGRRVMEHPI